MLMNAIEVCSGRLFIYFYNIISIECTAVSIFDLPDVQASDCGLATLWSGESHLVTKATRECLLIIY